MFSSTPMSPEQLLHLKNVLMKWYHLLLQQEGMHRIKSLLEVKEAKHDPLVVEPKHKIV